MSDINQRIQETIDGNKIVIYMKGSPSFPMCGFSATTIEIFNSLSVPYETVDVLQDGEVREGIKAFSNWPTIPQIYVDGKFLGGCDIIREMHAAGELKSAVATALQ
ncbi:MAG: Grx4 family monothiol glutaredoxin [Deltaproteobacteria bacterium]